MIKVAIYEDNESLRETLASIIRATPEFELWQAGEFGHCLDAIKNTSAFEPNVNAMDIDMPGKNGIEGLKEIKSRFPDINVIINTVFEDDDRIFQAIKMELPVTCSRKTVWPAITKHQGCPRRRA